MIRRILFFILTFTFLLAADPKVMVTVDQNRIYEGDSVTLTISVENGSDFPEVDLNVIEDFKIVSGPSQESNIQWINGEMSSSFSLVYIMIPVKKGELTIPPLAIKADGKKFQSREISITVYERNNSIAPDSEKKLKEQKYYLEAVVDNPTPYRGEQVTVVYTLYTRTDLSGFDIKEEPRYKGFWAQVIYSPRTLQLREVRKGGKKWYAATIKKVALFPTASGELEIEPMTAVIGVRIQDRSRSRQRFFSNMFSNTKNYTLASNSVKLNVRSLPESSSGKISAAVGDWNVSTSISATDVVQDEAVTFTIRIKGRGNLQAVDVQDVAFPAELEIFEPQITLKEEPFRDTIAGTKTIEYVMIPRVAGTIVIPPVELLYFDPKRGQWRTRTTKKITLNVTPAVRNSPTATGLTKTEISLMGKDIRFADDDQPEWGRRERGLISTKSALLLSASVLLFFVPGLLNYSQMKFSATAGSRKAKKALKEALSLLDRDIQNAESGYLHIKTALNRFISLKTGKNIQRPTEDILSEFQRKNISDDICKELETILKRGDMVRFAPVSGEDAVSDVNRVKDLLAKLETEWK